jgi:hypothetical protein
MAVAPSLGFPVGPARWGEWDIGDIVARARVNYRAGSLAYAYPESRSAKIWLL